jgi:hypothetical protein
MREMPRDDVSASMSQTHPSEAGSAQSDAGNVFRREGDYWLVVFEGQIVRLRDMKGVRYLGRLLADPGREFHVVDLAGVEQVGPGETTVFAEPGWRFPDAGDAGEMLDPRAKEAYRRRLTEIESDLEEARTLGDASRMAQANTERDFLVNELSRAVGLGGRDRRAGSAAERARASVTRAVRHAMGRIRAQHPPLGAHLERTIRTGTYCTYLPDPRVPVAWKR